MFVEESDLPKLNTHIELINSQIGQRSVHETDFVFLSKLGGEHYTVLDVGGNIGNSALSCHFVCPAWPVVSFEPNLSLNPYLDRAQDFIRSEGGTHRYLNWGFGVRTERCRFYIPRIGNWLAVGETSMFRAHFDESVVRDRLASYAADGKWDLIESEFSVRRFDDTFHEIAEIGNGDKLFIKIDIEGAELSMLEGMSSFLAVRKPLFMIENGDVSPVQDFLSNWGYQRFEYRAETGALAVPGPLPALNSFYVPANLAVAWRTSKIIL